MPIDKTKPPTSESITALAAHIVDINERLNLISGILTAQEPLVNLSIELLKGLSTNVNALRGEIGVLKFMMESTLPGKSL